MKAQFRAPTFLAPLTLVLSYFLGNLDLCHGQAQSPDAGIYMPDSSTLIYLPQINITIKSAQDKPRSTISYKNLTITSTTGQNNASVEIVFLSPEIAVKDVVATDLSLRLEIKLERGSWFLTSSFLSGTVGIGSDTTTLKSAALRTPMELTAPVPMSFHCGKYGPFSPKLVDKDGNKDKKNVTISVGVELLDFQFQPFMKNNSKFGNSYDCVGFFSIGILSGIFITIMLLGILSWAISMIMNVHTMDRFDDPKGKSIQVSATD